MNMVRKGIRAWMAGWLLMGLPALALAHAGVELRLDRHDLAQLRSLAPEADAKVRLHDIGHADAKSAEQAWSLRRIEVYTDDAQLWIATGKGLERAPRSPLQHYIGTRQGERLALSLMPDGSQGSGLLVTGQDTYQLDVMALSEGLHLIGKSTDAPLPDGSLPESDCMGGVDSPDARHGHRLPSLSGFNHIATPKVATRRVTLAIDTDNELLLEKFSNNTTNATNYITALVAAMNAIYEMDPGAGGVQLQLQIGHQILRPSTTPDPYPSTTGSPISDQLNEFGAYWMNNHGGVSRAFALMLSGKSPASNSAAGMAWILTSGSYCAATGQVFSGQTYGHYSINRVFKMPGWAGALDAPLVAHELGHNFGLAHSHCTASTGAFPASASTLDQCVSGETMSGNACYSGPVSCPTVGSAPGAPSGTLMSYCHVSSASCGSNVQLFHPTQVTTLNTRIGSQPSGCVVPIGGAVNQPPGISAPAQLPVFVAGTAPISGVSFSDPDAGTGSLTVTLAAPAGVTLSGSSSGGVTASGSGGNRTFQGTLSNLNAYFAAGNPRMAGAAFIGPANLQITINDNGHTGTGGAKTATANVQLRGGFLFANGFE